MADVQTLAKVFDAGFQRDKARDELPAKVLWRCVDFLPALDNALRKRGGWGQGSGNLNSVSSCTRAEIGGYAPFADDGHVLVFSDNGKAYAVRAWNSDAPILIDGVGAYQSPTCPPFWHKDRLIVCPPLMGNALDVRKYYKAGPTYGLVVLDESTTGGGIPYFTAGMSWGEYLVGINGVWSGARYPNRAWYSNVGQPGVFDPSNSYIDFPEELVACVALSNAQLFFGYQYTHVVTNDLPPPDSNFVVRKNVYAQGAFSAASLCRWKDSVIFANTQGIWKADTATIEDLTVKGGIHSFWREKMAGMSWRAGGRVSLGIYNEQLIVSAIDENNVERVVLGYDLNQNYWYELTNFLARSFIYYPQGQGIMNRGPGTILVSSEEELLFCWGNGPYLGKLSSAFSPGGASTATDFDGNVIMPWLETAYFKLGYPWLKRMRRAYLTYLASTSVAASKLLSVSATESPDGAYEMLGYLASQQFARSAPIQVKKRAVGIGFKIQAQAPISDLKLYEFEMESHPLEGSN